ncbi:MAG: hypothetical protein ACLFVQ_11525 [Chitinispirillaceae bacterium]
MKTIRNLLAALVALLTATGCMIVEVPYEDGDEGGEYVEYCYVDAYVDIPYEVKVLICDAVNGYAMPPLGRYGSAIHPTGSYEPYNLPSYVMGDFNGDGYSDYAYMFSKVTWAEGDWYLKTKMLIVVSTCYGYEVASEIVLGTVAGSCDRPVEEYWGIRLLRRGTHTVTTYQNGFEREETIELHDEGIYLASVDPYERSVFYVRGMETYEMRMDMGAIAKKRNGTIDERADRLIDLRE